MVEIKSTFLETCSASDTLHFNSATMQRNTKEFLSTFIHHESFKSFKKKKKNEQEPVRGWWCRSSWAEKETWTTTCGLWWAEHVAEIMHTRNAYKILLNSHFHISWPSNNCFVIQKATGRQKAFISQELSYNLGGTSCISIVEIIYGAHVVHPPTCCKRFVTELMLSHLTCHNWITCCETNQHSFQMLQRPHSWPKMISAGWPGLCSLSMCPILWACHPMIQSQHACE